MKVLAKQWKPIPGFDGYEVSNSGQVRSYWVHARGGRRGELRLSTTAKMMSLATAHAGHRRVMLGRGDARRQMMVHRLVLMAFVGPCPKGLVCCHNNGNPDDNRLENLRWDTLSSNQRDAVRHGTHNPKRGTRQAHAKLNDDLVRQIRRTDGTLSQAEWARRIGCCRQLIASVRNRQCWAHVE